VLHGPSHRRMTRALLIAGAICGSFIVPAQSCLAADFVVLDQKAAEELGEITRLYIDGRLIATIRLDAATTEVRVPVSAPDAKGAPVPLHDYTLCGEIAFRNREGAREVHLVSGQGVLPDPAGRQFLAVGARDFTQFYLVDPTDPAAVRMQSSDPAFCQTPVS
jgi:hypothetical protein